MIAPALMLPADTVLTLLDYASVAVFALTGALVASRSQLDIVGFVFVACLTAVAAPPAPVFGGWRNLDTAADAAVREEDMPFAMLPVEVPRRTRLALLDPERKQTVCCFEVVSVALEDPVLRHRFDLPEVWITDLRNGWDLDARAYAPQVFALQRRDALEAGVAQVHPGALGCKVIVECATHGCLLALL